MDKLATHERVHIFLDEVNFVRDWAIEIKRIADGDKFDRVTVMCTGSPFGVGIHTHELIGRGSKGTGISFDQSVSGILQSSMPLRLASKMLH
jgi:predicted AAA+ superfamily ATPase